MTAIAAISGDISPPAVAVGHAGAGDAVGWLDSGGALTAAVAAGVGGGAASRVAAELALRLLMEAQAEGRAPIGMRAHAAAALEAANRWLHAQARADPALAGAACAITALLLRGRRAFVLHVGDTRLYRMRDGVLSRHTTDHCVGASVLSRALGAEPELRLEAGDLWLLAGDRFLLCGPALWRGVTDRDMAARLAVGGPADGVSRALSERAGGATALVLDVAALPQPQQWELEAEMRAVPILPAPRPGAVIDGYALGTLIADGRYSRVFRATGADGRAVIAKFPKPADANEALLRLAFLREAWIAARLRSPFVGEVIEVPPEQRSCLYSLMPFYDGETLEQRLRRDPILPLADGLAIASRLAAGVGALHRAGVIHRDIKPDNVVLVRGGQLRLIDLGVARLPTMEDFPASDAPGTPSYMAPEMFSGEAGNVATDIYALGVTIFRLFARAYPYGEVEPFARPRFGRPAALTRFRPDLPDWLGDVLDKAVAVRPEDRFADAAELIFALENGALHTAPSRPGRQPLLQRDPLRFYQMLSLILALLLAASVFWIIPRLAR